MYKQTFSAPWIPSCRPRAVPRGVEEAVRVRGRARARRLRQEGRRGQDRSITVGQACN